MAYVDLAEVWQCPYAYPRCIFGHVLLVEGKFVLEGRNVEIEDLSCYRWIGSRARWVFGTGFNIGSFRGIDIEDAAIVTNEGVYIKALCSTQFEPTENCVEGPYVNTPTTPEGMYKIFRREVVDGEHDMWILVDLEDLKKIESREKSGDTDFPLITKIFKENIRIAFKAVRASVSVEP